jgi:DNA polymerase-3 subunit alpha
LAIKNVGHNVVDAIVKERENAGIYQSIFDFVSRLNPRDLNKKSLESLIKAGCFDKLEERGKLLSNVERLLEQSRTNNKNFNNGQRDLFEGGNVKLNSYLALTETVPVSKMEKLKWEKELLGLYVTAHPLDDFKGIFAKKIWPISKISSDLSQRIIRTGGIISKVKKIITKSGRPMLFLSLEDLTDKIEVIAFPGVLEKNPACFQENKIVLISGRVDSREGIPKIVCEEIEEIIEA